MDKALETTYTMRGITRVVRTEPTGKPAKTQADHLKACRAAVDELHKLTREEWVKEIDAEIKRIKRHGTITEQINSGYLADRRKRVASDKFEVAPPSNAKLRNPFPPRPAGIKYNIDDYRTPEDEPVAAPVVAPLPSADGLTVAEWFDAILA